MKIRKAVITTAGRKQRALPLQTVIDRDGLEKPILRILLEEVADAGVEEVCVVVAPGDESAYSAIAGDHVSRLRFVAQPEARGYADALFRARGFVAGSPFLHLVGDHLYIAPNARRCARMLVEVAEGEECAVSAVQATRESALPSFGAVGGQQVPQRAGLYRVDTVLEKPTPTEAEQRLIVPGLRAGHYLCFFGVHVLTPVVMDLLEQAIAAKPSGATLSDALARLPAKEQYLAWEHPGRRYDLGARYGVLTTQVALALSGAGRDEVLTNLLELLALRAMNRPRE